jgi:membrane glycosyltransferase
MAQEKTKTSFTQRLSQIRLAFSKTAELDDKLVPMVIGIPLGILAVLLALGVVVFQQPVLFGVVGLLIALLTAMVIFGRRAQKVQMSMIEGQPGAAAAVLQQMRGLWTVQPAVAFTRNQDFVHRMVGRPGIVLVGEGSRARVAQLLKQEKRRVARVAGDAPIHEVTVGDGEDQVPLAKLSGHVTRLPRALKPREVGTLEQRLGGLRDDAMPIPKGPMPRPPRGKRR